MRLAGDSWDRRALVDFLAAFIEGGTAAVESETWQALETRPDGSGRSGQLA
jgi:hypothetical protein